jgi:hypothetical protein
MAMQGRSGRVSLDFQEKASKRWENRIIGLSCPLTYLRGGEEVVAARIAGQNTVVIRARETATRNVTTHWRIKDPHTKTTYLIKSIIPSEDRRWLDFTCQSERS